jgi:hypothetical protein
MLFKSLTHLFRIYSWLAKYLKHCVIYSIEMDLSLYLKDGDDYKQLSVPLYVVRDLLRDRLSKSEIDRLFRLSTATELPEKIDTGSVIVDFSKKQARCFQAGLGVDDLEPTWKVQIEKKNLLSY